MIERETEGQLARLRDKSARSIPEWVGTLTEESSAWQLLYPGKVPKKTTVNTDSDDDDDDDDADTDDGKKKELKAGTTGLTSWPKFIQVVCLSRRRPKSSLSTLLSTEQLGTYHATYRQAARDGPVELEKVILTPMVVHRNLGIHYQRRMVEGWTHDEAMKEIHKYCGLPVVWRGCLPFTGTFDPTRLRNAWIVNWIIWCFLLGWLAWSFLSLRDELPWDGIFGTLILGIVVEPGSKIAKAIAIGLVVYLVLEVNVKSRALYERHKAGNSPDAHAERTASSVTVEDADADDNEDADGYGDDEAGDSPRKQSQYTPPQALKALARPLVAISPAKTYEAMQIGAALRRLDERKHQETTAIAKKLVPKLNAEQRRHEEEISQLDLCRATCIDNATVETIDAQKTGMEHAHCAALGLLEADVCPPTLYLENSQACFPTGAHKLLLIRCHSNLFTGDVGTGERGAGSSAGNCDDSRVGSKIACHAITIAGASESRGRGYGIADSAPTGRLEDRSPAYDSKGGQSDREPRARDETAQGSACRARAFVDGRYGGSQGH